MILLTLVRVCSNRQDCGLVMQETSIADRKGDILEQCSLSMMKGLLIAFLLLVAVMSAQPQDVVKVSPETHSVLLENAQVRVLDVHVKPGEKVAMHSHPAGILYYLSDAKLRITYPGGKTAERVVKAGTAVWSEAVTHAAENIGATELHEVQTELKETPNKSEPSEKIEKSPM
jgi:beta-alanine degradation protein BauB